jgi:hypothetical protein
MREYRIVNDEFGFFWVERRAFSHIDYELGLECGMWITSSSLCKTKNEANQYLLDELMRNDEVSIGKQKER